MGLGINVAFSFFMKIIHVCMYTHAHRGIHTPNLLDGHAIFSIKKSRRRVASGRVTHAVASASVRAAGAGCAASHFYL